MGGGTGLLIFPVSGRRFVYAGGQVRGELLDWGDYAGAAGGLLGIMLVALGFRSRGDLCLAENLILVYWEKYVGLDCGVLVHVFKGVETGRKLGGWRKGAEMVVAWNRTA